MLIKTAMSNQHSLWLFFIVNSEGSNCTGDYLCFLTFKFKVMDFIWYSVIGIIAGFVAGKIMRGGGFGLVVNLVLGLVGGVLGGWLFALIGIHSGGLIGSLVSSVVGAVLLLWIASLFKKS